MNSSSNKGWFRKGSDPRRACFTSEQARAAGSKPTCHRLTNEDRRKGGEAAFARVMAEVRMSMNLPLPNLDAVRDAAAKLLKERLTKLGKMPPKQRRVERADVIRLARQYDLEIAS